MVQDRFDQVFVERQAHGMTIVMAGPHPAADHSRSRGINRSRPRWFLARDPDGNLTAFGSACK
jgi:hypothetical protein